MPRRKCAEQDPAENDITLRFFANGVLAVCTYYPHGCQDDCLLGIVIDRVVFSGGAGQ